MFARKIGRQASVARQLVTHGYRCSSATRTMSHRWLTSTSSTNMAQQSLSSHFIQYYPLVDHMSTHRGLGMCRTYCDAVTSSESEGTSSGEEDEWTSLYDRIARASLLFVDKHGWSQEAIHEGVKSLGLSGVAHGVLSNGGHDLLKYFEQQCNDELEKYLQTELQPLLFNEEPDKSAITLEQFIVAAIMKRLQLVQPFVLRWHEALTMKLNVTSNWSHFHNLSIIADDIWHYSKDQSIDCDWYVKRGYLAVVYKRAEDHMIKDFSHDLTDTKQHVEQMVQQMMAGLSNIQLARLMTATLGEVSCEYLSEMGSRVHKIITDDDYCMDELEQALSVTGLTGDHDDQDDEVDQDDHDVDYGRSL